METVPTNIRIGGTLGLIGGIACIVCMVLFFRAEESALLDMGVYMLVAVMFFALAGGFFKGGQWSWSVLLLMTFLTIGAVGGSVIAGAMDFYVGAVLALIGVLIAANLAMPTSRVWADRLRI
ncbi:MAG: hypothetical protein LBH88_03195 [Candidatus Methanoplasma sp.]|jgi:hypothetical protein|nr:hypothetical protein [Candidatus Methanoplasma sp.]